MRVLQHTALFFYLVLFSFEITGQRITFPVKNYHISSNFQDFSRDGYMMRTQIEFIKKDPNLTSLKYKFIPVKESPKWTNQYPTFRFSASQNGLSGQLDYFYNPLELEFRTGKNFISCGTDTSAYWLIMTDPGVSEDSIYVKFTINTPSNTKVFSSAAMEQGEIYDTVFQIKKSWQNFLNYDKSFCLQDSFMAEIQSDYPQEWYLEGTNYVQKSIPITRNSITKIVLKNYSSFTISEYWYVNLMKMHFNKTNGKLKIKLKVYHQADSINTVQEFEFTLRVCLRFKSEDVVLNDPTLPICLNDTILLQKDTSKFKNIIIQGSIRDSILVAKNNTYDCYAIDRFGCSVIDTVKLNLLKPFPEKLCLVTVDSATNKNTVIYDKTGSKNTKTFRIYKQGNVFNQFDLLTERAYSEPNIYIDNTSNPDAFSDFYKVTALDSCGNESALSTHHKTIHLSASQGINNRVELRWEPYEGLGYPSVNIYRGTNPNDLQLLTSRPGNTISYTDVNPPRGLLYYQTEIVAPNVCEIKRSGDFVVSSRSNIHFASATATDDLLKFKWDVTPTNQNHVYRITIDESILGTNYMMIDGIGRTLLKDKLDSKEVLLNLEQFSAGVYYVVVGASVKKIIRL